MLDVARDLLGRRLHHDTPDGSVVVRLVEVEAYGAADDMASHAVRGRTRRNEVMFGTPGHAYVYFTYGMWHCVNVVCQPAGEAAAVLLRAGRVVAGADLAQVRRPRATARDLARGPARLCTALGIGPDSNGADVTRSALWLSAGEAVPDALVRTGPRVGVTGGAELPWRYWVADEPAVSAYRAAAPRRRSVT